MRKTLVYLFAAASLLLNGGCCQTCSTDTAATSCDKKLIAAKVSVKPDQIQGFIAATPDILAASRAEPGCVSYTMYQNPHEPASFFFFEQWKDQAAIDAHFAAPHFKAFGDKIKDMVAAPPEIVIYDACVPPPAK